MTIHFSLSTDGSFTFRAQQCLYTIRQVPECIPRAVRTLCTGTCAKLQRLRSTRLPQGVRNCTNSTLVNSIFTGHLLRLDSTLYVLISLRVTTAVVANRLPETNYARAQKQTSTVMKYWPMMWIIECWDLFPPCRSSRRCRDRKTPWWRQSCLYVRLLALEWTRVLVEEPSSCHLYFQVFMKLSSESFNNIFIFWWDFSSCFNIC